MSAREALAARFTQDLGPAGWVIRPAPWVPKQVAKDQPAVAVWLSSIRPEGMGLLHELTVNLYLPKASADAAAEDEAETALDELLTSLQRLGSATWTLATRQVFDNVISGWQVTCQLASTDTYSQAILAGG